MTDRLIYAALVAVWMAYLVPLAIRRYREVSGRGSIESFSSSMLALGRHVGWGDGSTADTARPAPGGTPAGSSVTARPAPGGTPAGSAVAARPAAGVPGAPTGPAPSPLDRPSARVAAARRRRTLLVLLALTGLTGVLVATTLLLWPAVLVPLALTAGFLAACRIQSAREEDAAWARAAAAQAASPVRAARPAVRVEFARGEPVGDEPDDEDTVVLTADDAAKLRALVVAPAPAGGGAYPAPVSAVLPPTAAYVGGAHPEPVSAGAHPAPVSAGAGPPSAGAASGATWDPRPFTLPTYVTKPRATRTVRGADLRGRDPWTSGLGDAEQTPVESAADTVPEQRRAVGG